MNIVLLCVGSLKERFWEDATKEYQKRLQKFCKLEIKELSEQNKFSGIDKIIAEEGKEIIANIKGYSILFDIEGKEQSSEQFAKNISSLFQKSSTLTFIIGGSYGVSEEVKKRVDERLSFGKITLPHNLARVVALEQIYRAFMINGGGKYHK